MVVWSVRASLIRATRRGTPHGVSRFGKADDLMERVASRMEPRIRAAFLTAVSKTRIPVGALTDVLEAGDLDAAMKLITGSLALDPKVAEGLREAIAATFTAVARPTAGSLRFRFDMVSPQAVKYAAGQSSRLIKGIGDNRAAMRRVIASGFTEGIPPRALARDVEQLIGLTETQTGQVTNYKAGRRAAGLTEARVQELGDRFYRKLLRRRATVIARQESVTASLKGKLAAWDEAIEQEVIDPAVTAKVWITAYDERVCSICRPMHNKVVALVGGEFNTLKGNDELTPKQVKSVKAFNGGLSEAGSAHILCRCGVVLRVFDTPAELVGALEAGALT